MARLDLVIFNVEINVTFYLYEISDKNAKIDDQ